MAYCPCRIGMIAGDHHGFDAGPYALDHGLLRLASGWVL
jgi:hypothetical protein